VSEPGPAAPEGDPGEPAPEKKKARPRAPAKPGAGLPPEDRARADTPTVHTTSTQESAEVRKHRHSQEKAQAAHEREEGAKDAAHRRWRESGKQVAGGAVLAFAFAASLYGTFYPAGLVDPKWAPVMLNTIVSGCLGYLLRGKGDG
jgi:hypothetical protein